MATPAEGNAGGPAAALRKRKFNLKESDDEHEEQEEDEPVEDDLMDDHLVGTFTNPGPLCKVIEERSILSVLGNLWNAGIQMFMCLFSGILVCDVLAPMRRLAMQLHVTEDRVGVPVEIAAFFALLTPIFLSHAATRPFAFELYDRVAWPPPIHRRPVKMIDKNVMTLASTLRPIFFCAAVLCFSIVMMMLMAKRWVIMAYIGTRIFLLGTLFQLASALARNVFEVCDRYNSHVARFVKAQLAIEKMRKQAAEAE